MMVRRSGTLSIRRSKPAKILDRRASVLLRLGRIYEALAVYDQVLAKAPTEASSLYGRAIIRQRKGYHANAVKDMDAALKVDPDTRERFEGYGMLFCVVKMAIARGRQERSDGPVSSLLARNGSF